MGHREKSERDIRGKGKELGREERERGKEEGIITTHFGSLLAKGKGVPGRQRKLLEHFF